MRSKYKGFYKLTDSEIQEIWSNCIFTFDANVLLNLYRYSSKTSKDLLNIFSKLSKNIWLTYQAGLEFHRNRLNVLSGQKETYSKLRRDINEYKTKIKNSLESNRHPFINESDDYISKLDDLFEEIIKKLIEETEKIQRKSVHDEILKEVTELFNQKVGDEYSEEKLIHIYEEGEERYRNEIPPGYKDRKTKRNNDQFGDLILWYQIIDKAKQEKKSIILVTDDQKEDWWRIHNGKTIGPRPELIQEMLSRANEKFYMYKIDPFLQYAVKYMDAKVNKNTYEEIRTVEKLRLERNKRLARLLTVLERAELRGLKAEEKINKANLRLAADHILNKDINFENLDNTIENLVKHSQFYSELAKNNYYERQKLSDIINNLNYSNDSSDNQSESE